MTKLYDILRGAPHNLHSFNGEKGVTIEDNNAIGMTAEVVYNGQRIPLVRDFDSRDFASFVIPDSIRGDSDNSGKYKVIATDRNGNSTTFSIYTLEGHVSEKPFEL